MVGIDELDGRSVSTLRTLNARVVLTHLRGAETPTVSDIARNTGLSRPTVEATLHDLAARDLVEEVQPDRGRSLGRPARRYRFRGESGYVVGVDAGPHRLVGAISDLTGRRVASRMWVIASPPDADAISTAITDLTAELLRTVGAAPADLDQLTIGVPGVVDDDGILWKSVVVPEWVATDITGLVEPTFPRAIIQIDNDANLAAIAEYAALEDDAPANVVSLIVGHRISSGVILDGRLHRGHRGTAGEVGALPELGWADAVARLSAATPHHSLAETFSRDDHESRSAIEQFAEEVAVGTAALVLALGADAVIVGGGIAQAGDAFLKPLSEALERRCLYAPKVIQAVVGPEAVARGALQRSLEAAHERMAQSLA